MEELTRTHNQSTLPSKWKYRKQSFTNLLQMGHCAPTVMKTILDINSTDKEWLVKLSAGLPGGIGNTGFECGGITSPLVLLGIKYGLYDTDRGLPVIFDKGHALFQSFLVHHKTFKCTEIRQDDHFPKHCILPVLRSPERYMNVQNYNQAESIPLANRLGYSHLYAHMVDNDFHCARAVFMYLSYTPEQNQELFDAISAYLGGTLFMGYTCSALTAGIMAIGLLTGEIEKNPFRVMRMLAIMTIGGNAFDEKINKFNSSMNRGYTLSKWFSDEFGSTQCQAITNCDFSNPAGVNNYIEGGCITKCKQITEKVAIKTQTII